MPRISERNCASFIFAAALAALLLTPAPVRAQRKKEFTTPTPLPAGSTLIAGFLAKYEENVDKRQPDIQLATRLRALALPGVYIETVGRSSYGDALRLFLAAMGRDPKGACGPQGCRDVRLIFYGYLQGAEEMRKAERKLESLRLPVALAVEVTGASECGGAIPPNVAQAANICMDQRWADHGRKRIRAEDPVRTQILANLRTSTGGRWLDISAAVQPDPKTWPREPYLEFDPIAWNHAEDYILDELRREGIPGAPAPPH
jgi:hypothetical protein